MRKRVYIVLAVVLVALAGVTGWQVAARLMHDDAKPIGTLSRSDVRNPSSRNAVTSARLALIHACESPQVASFCCHEVDIPRLGHQGGLLMGHRHQIN